jgi:uncharacterized membrane protein YbhN (UPF0104 family)
MRRASAIGGAVILVVVVWWVGTGPFLAGFRVLDAQAVLIALAAGLVSTLCCVWRWRRIAVRLGVDLAVGEAVAAYYRSQFLNATLPGGVVGDLHRAVRHGRDLGDVGLGVRAVVVERSAGLAAQVTIAAAALLVAPSPVRRSGAVAFGVAAVLAVAVIIALVLARATAAVVLASSGVALAAHIVVFVAAARAAGVTAPLPLVVELTVLALLAMAVPVSFAGWGPREGVAAWAFAAAGLSAAQGVTTAVAYGALALIGCLPGAAILAVPWLRPLMPAPVRAVRALRAALGAALARRVRTSRPALSALQQGGGSHE